MVCTAQCQGASLNGGTSVLDLCRASEKHIRRGDIPQRLMVALRIVVFDKGGNRLLQLPGKVVMFQTNHVLNRAMIALDFALGLGMVRRAPCMADAVLCQIVGQITGDLG
jgi:hypothetical protein